MGGRPSFRHVSTSAGLARRMEDAAVDLGMQGLDPAVEDFGVAGEGGDVDDGQAGVAQGGAVPPVERSSTPSAARPRAKSSSPSCRIR
jgi:hypothetical protein